MQKQNDYQIDKALFQTVKNFIHSDKKKSELAIEVFELYKGRKPTVNEMANQLNISQATAYRRFKENV